MEIKQGGVVSRLLADVPIPRMFRAEQLDRASEGLRLMPDEITTPVMPQFGNGVTASPEVQAEIDALRARQAEAAAAARAGVKQ